jgi:heme/copper-type cytochrome/quinol oxidase subunit 1
MSTLLSRMSRAALPLAVACAAILATANSALAQVATADLAARPVPPVPKAPEQLMAAHGVLMIILGVIFLGLVVGACLIPVKRGHMD